MQVVEVATGGGCVFPSAVDTGSVVAVCALQILKEK
jgi:hypothetical protein